VARLAANNLRVLTRRLPLSNSGLFPESHLALIPRQEHAAEQFIADTSLRLTILHVGVPHPPWVFNAGIVSDARLPADLSGYYGNVARADQLLAALSRRIDALPGSKPIVVVTSDHAFGGAWEYDGVLSRRVPFIVRFPDDRGIRYDRPVNTAVMRDLSSAILQQSVASGRQLATWLDSVVSERRQRGERGFVDVEARAANQTVDRGARR
jgi:hypothetical protein